MKQILFIFIFILFIVTGLWSQNRGRIDSKPKGPWIGFSVSPELGFRKLINTKGTEYLDSVISFRDSLETPRWGYTAGLSLLFNIKNKWAIETGVQYSNTRFMRVQNFTYPNPDPKQLVKFSSFFNYHYINFPLILRCSLGSKKIKFTSVGGISANMFIKDTQCHTYDYQNGDSNEKKGVTGFKYHQFSLVSSFGIGIFYAIKEKMILIFEPTFRYGLTETVKEPITNNLYSGGMNISFYFH